MAAMGTLSPQTGAYVISARDYLPCHAHWQEKKPRAESHIPLVCCAEQRLAAGKIEIPNSLYQGLKEMATAAATDPAPEPTSTLPHPPITSITPEAASISSTSPTITSTAPDATATTPEPAPVSTTPAGLSSISSGVQTQAAQARHLRC